MPSCSVANRCWQLSRILSNTGAVSATELLITCSTSAVAVCCSSASFVSLNSRTFSMAITAWSANVCSTNGTFSGIGPAFSHATLIVPMGSPSRSSGTLKIRKYRE